MKARSALLTVAAAALAVTAEYKICHVNTFHTQPYEAAFGTSGHSVPLVKRANGTNSTDPDRPGELILDTSAAAKRSSIFGLHPIPPLSAAASPSRHSSPRASGTGPRRRHPLVPGRPA